MPFEYLFTSIWRWLADSGLNIAILIVLAFLVPRAGRLATRVLERRVAEDPDQQEGKSKLALAGVGVYVAELIAFFIIAVLILQQFGFSLAGAAIPATVVSAAVGFGAQSIIADFLAGFFILSEKQYGVGDWVAFTGNGVDVEGTVIQITMRSTQIRTIDQSTVNIPNSTARVAINRSNYWSRAVVVMPVPLLGSQSATDALRRSEAATRRALARPEIASELIGELDVHPAVSVDPPSTVGMPWTVDMRFMTQVKAGSQWLVERAVRMSILDEFWDEYGSATTVDGTLIDKVTTSAMPASYSTLNDDTPTELMREVSTPEAVPGAETETEQLFAADEATATIPVADTASDTGSETATDSDQPDVPPEFETERGEDPASQDAADERGGADEAEPEDRDDQPKRRSTVRDVLTAGRRMRPSTAVLLLVLLGLLLLRGLSASGMYNDEHVSGVLAPPPLTPVTDTAPTTTAEPEPQPPGSTEPTDSVNTVDTTTPATPTGTDAKDPPATGNASEPYTPGYQAPSTTAQQGEPQAPRTQPAQEPNYQAPQQTSAPANTPQPGVTESAPAAPTAAPAQTANPIR